MRLVFVFVVALFTDILALPVAKEGQREDVVARCLVEVLSKALSKPDSQLDQDCKDILQAGVKHAPLDKKSEKEPIAHEEAVNGHTGMPEPKPADVKDIEALLKTVEEKREIPEDERSQESWSLDKRHENDVEEEREKRSGWRPGRIHQKKHKRGEEEEDNERSQESWGLDKKRSEDDEEEDGEEREKRKWRPGRYHQQRSKRDEEPLGDEREEPEEERSQETWDVDKRGEDERSKRIWKPTHRYHHKKGLRKRSDEPTEGEEYEERSQESWGLDKRDWRPGRVHQTRHRRDEEMSDEAREDPDEERSQEYWDFDTGRQKREWRRGRVHQTRHKRDEELSEEVREEPDEERSQEYWDVDGGREKREWRRGRVHQTRHKRDEELSEEVREEPDEERSQEYWDVDGGREKREWRRGRVHQTRHKRGNEVSEEARVDPYEERSQEYWDFDTGYDKRDWRPGRHHQKKHKRDEELPEEEDGDRSQESWGLDKRHENDEGAIEKRIWKPTHRYHHKKKLHKRGGESSEEEEQRSDAGELDEELKDRDEALRYLAEKRNPWIFRGYYHPAWYKREERAAASNKMDELAKLLSYKINQLANHTTQEEVKRSTQQKTLTPQEEKELENLAAMDMELQKIAAKLHENNA